MPSKEVLDQLYNTECMSQRRIGKQFGVSKGTVMNWLKRHGISTVGRMGLPVAIPPKSELERMYSNEEMIQEEIGNHFGVHSHTVCNWLKHYNIPTRGSNGTLKVEMPPKADLEKLINEGLDQHQIAESYGVHDITIFRWCERLGIPGMANNFRCHTPEHINWKYAVFDRDNRTCQMCRATKTYIEAHHIVPYSDHPELAHEIENGITLCEQCHNNIKGREYNYIQQFAAITQPHLHIHEV